MSGRRGKRFFLLALCLACTVLFTALGVWQVERLAWKRELIARVDARLRAAPTPLPPRSSWPAFAQPSAEYRRVTLRGTFAHEAETLVDALTERGPGYWVLTPLRTADGTVLINRGFVPPERKAAGTRAAGQRVGTVSLTGLVRTSEPGGRFLRPNAPAADRWYARDVAAIAHARDLADAAPFFIDADAAPNPGGYPVGGLTVVQFRNAHLVYALTWFALAALSLTGLVLTARTRNNPA